MTKKQQAEHRSRDDDKSQAQHDAVVQLINDYYARHLSPAQTQQMRAHLRDCDACRSHYDAMAKAEQRVLGRREAQLVSSQRMLHSVLQAASGDAVADQLLKDKPCLARRFWRQILAWGLGSAVVAAAMFVLVINPQFLVSNKQVGLRARGSTASADSLGLGLSGVRADATLYDARRPEGLSLDDNLRFSYSNSSSDADKAARYLFVFGLDAALRPYWYYPLPGDGHNGQAAQSIAIESGPEVLQRSLPYETALRRRHHAGALWVYALFSREPLKLDDVRSKIQAAAKNKLKAQALVWPDKVQVQRIELLLVAGRK